MKHENMRSMQDALKAAYNWEASEQEAFEIKRFLVDLIRTLDAVDREVNGGQI